MRVSFSDVIGPLASPAHYNGATEEGHPVRYCASRRVPGAGEWSVAEGDTIGELLRAVAGLEGSYDVYDRQAQPALCVGEIEVTAAGEAVYTPRR